MKRRWTILAILILVALPSLLYGRWIKDKVYLQTDSVGKVEFSHFSHMEKDSIGKNCPTCHNEPFHIVTEKNPTFTMKDMEEGKSCGVCHDGDTAFGVAGDCTTCHTNAGDQVIQTENVGSVSFSHAVHIEMFGCGECHPDTFKAKANSNQVGMKAMEAGESCGACHDGDTAFSVKEDCSSCHAGDITYINEDAGNITFPHAAHTAMFGCDECHPDLFQAKRGANKATMEDMENGESCGACHDGDTAFGVAEDCESCHEM